MENALYMLNMFIHSLATVVFVGGPFYMVFVVTKERIKLGPPLEYRLERFFENMIDRMPLICFSAWGIVVATGFAFPLIYYAYHGEFKPISSFVRNVMVLKHVLVFAVFGVMLYMYFGIKPRIDEIMHSLSPDKPIDEEVGKQLVAWRTKRRNSCKLVFSIQLGILLLSGILAFAT